MLVGGLAVAVAAHAGGAVTSKRGAIETVASYPLGSLLLVVIAIGLLCYGLWGFVRAFLDPLHRGSDLEGVLQRVGYFVSGCAYTALAIPTVKLLIGAQSSATGGAASLAANALKFPGGQWLVGVFGVLWLLGAGFGQLYQAYSARFRRDFESWHMSGEQLKWATWIGRAGYAARGVVFSIVGYFIIRAALNSNAAQVMGADGALATIAAQPYGTVLLAIVAVGLVCFGIYSLCCSVWMHIDIDLGQDQNHSRGVSHHETSRSLAA